MADGTHQTSTVTTDI